ncbi:MAG: hypothetical protein KGI80_06460 [Verrucomicrobiota bacterium]|nr:hypothetical protein [Verrucomicrobiota bacterium]
MVDQTKLPHVGGDLLFAFLLGVANTIICSFLHTMRLRSFYRLFSACLCLNFFAYGLLKWIPLGIQVRTFTGYFLAAGLVTIGSFLINCFEIQAKEDPSSLHMPE